MSDKLSLNVRVDVDQVIEEIVHSGMSYQEIADLIFDIDMKMADWDFTNILYRHFKKEHDLYLEETNDET